MIGPLLRTRRWAGFTVLVVVVIIAFGLLSAWQWSRAEDRRAEGRILQDALTVTPLPLSSALDSTPGVWDWTPSVATGTFDASNEVLVRKRPLEARNGFWVLTPLDTGAAIVWVNRGWVPVGADALNTPSVTPPPTGLVEVNGYLKPYEQASPDRNDGLPSGQVAAPALSLLPDVGASATGFLQLASSNPEQRDVRPLPLPEIDESRNISYAVQWLLFAAVALGGWFYFLRREAREDATPGTSPSEPPPHPPAERAIPDRSTPWTSA